MSNLKPCPFCVSPEKEKLQEENARLRKALQHIADSPLVPVPCECGNGEILDDCQIIAINALKDLEK